MAEVLQTLPIDFLAINCASSFRGLHEAVLNQNGNRPQILTCTHEEIAVSMAQGYAKIEGKPMAVACHGTVGLQHAAMAIYNAWCDRVPLYLMIGNIVQADKRGLRAEWVACGARPGGAGARLRQVGRPAGLVAAFRRVRGARLRDRDDAADGPGAAVAGRRAPGEPDR